MHDTHPRSSGFSPPTRHTSSQHVTAGHSDFDISFSAPLHSTLLRTSKRRHTFSAPLETEFFTTVPKPPPASFRLIPAPRSGIRFRYNRVVLRHTPTSPSGPPPILAHVPLHMTSSPPAVPFRYTQGHRQGYAQQWPCPCARRRPHSILPCPLFQDRTIGHLPYVSRRVRDQLPCVVNAHLPRRRGTSTL